MGEIVGLLLIVAYGFLFYYVGRASVDTSSELSLTAHQAGEIALLLTMNNRFDTYANKELVNYIVDEHEEVAAMWGLTKLK